MQCMKCGREIPVGQVFCEECLTEMEKYPVEPGTVVTLPVQSKPQPAKKQMLHRPAQTPEERVKTMRKQLRFLSWSLTLAVALLVGVTALAVSMLQEDQNEELPGQNYSAEGEEKGPPEWNLDWFETPELAEEATEEESTESPQNLNGIIGNETGNAE